MNRYSLIFGLALILLLTIIACGGGATSTSAVPATPISTPEPTANQQPSPTVAPTSTPEPTATQQPSPTVAPTSTPEPTATQQPSPTVAPTSTPEPTATQQPSPTDAPTPTPEPTATTVPSPTDTPSPTVTQTLEPTDTPSPTDTPVAEVPGISVITIEPSKDNTLYEDIDGLLSNGAGGSARRSIIAFDFSGNIPAGATINGVSLTLNVSRTQAGEEDVNIHRLLADWGEGASDAAVNEGRGTAPEPGYATWIHTHFDSEIWQTPGGDFSSAASASEPVGGLGPYIWKPTDELVADVQGWLDDPLTNFGWLLLGNETGSRTAKRFYSKENPLTANRPSLTVEFTSP